MRNKNTNALVAIGGLVSALLCLLTVAWLSRHVFHDQSEDDEYLRDSLLLHQDLPEAVSLLYDGANINYRYEDGSTYLMKAVGRGDTDLVKFLLQHGASADLANSKGDTALSIAGRMNRKDLISILTPVKSK
jgi:ankyrin repeat protein